MTTAKVFLDNGTQVVRMPAEARFDQSVTSVNVRVMGKERILSPLEHTWDSFFDGSAGVTEDFINQRATQEQASRETPKKALDD